MSRRRQARELAVQMLYQADLGEASMEDVLEQFVNGHFPSEKVSSGGGHGVVEYATNLATSTWKNLKQVDELIRGQADHWRLERMAPVDRNILRLAVAEFLFEEDVPKLVVVDEAIELGKRLGSEQSGSFINGVLDGLLKKHTFPGRMK